MNIIPGLGWLSAADAVFEGIAFLVSLLITLLWLRLYRVSKESAHLYFSLGFLFITLSFLGKVFATSVVFLQHKLDADFAPVFASSEPLFSFGRFAFVALVLIGYLVILMLSLKVSNQRLVAVLCGMTLLFAVLATNTIWAFYLMAFIMLAVISSQFFKNASALQTRTSRLITIGFFLLAIHYALLLMNVFFGATTLLYSVALVVQLLSFLALLGALMRVYAQ